MPGLTSVDGIIGCLSSALSVLLATGYGFLGNGALRSLSSDECDRAKAEPLAEPP